MKHNPVQIGRMTEKSGPSGTTDSGSKPEPPSDSLSSQRVFKKSSPNSKLTLYLSSRDLVVSSGRIDRLQGVLLVDPEFVEDRKVYGQITLTFRYGREDEEVMGLKFCNEAVMCLAQLYPAHPNNPAVSHPEGITPLQEALIRRLGPNAYPFNMEITPLAPPSVQLVPAKEYTGAPIGTSYDIRAYIADRADEKLNRRTTVRMGIRVVQRAFAPPSPHLYNPNARYIAPGVTTTCNPNNSSHHHHYSASTTSASTTTTTNNNNNRRPKVALFGCKSAPPLDNNSRRLLFPPAAAGATEESDNSGTTTVDGESGGSGREGREGKCKGDQEERCDDEGERRVAADGGGSSDSMSPESESGRQGESSNSDGKSHLHQTTTIPSSTTDSITADPDGEPNSGKVKTDHHPGSSQAAASECPMTNGDINNINSAISAKEENVVREGVTIAEATDNDKEEVRCVLPKLDVDPPDDEEFGDLVCADDINQMEQIRSMCSSKRPSLAVFLADIPCPHAIVEKPFLLSDGKVELEAELNKAVFHHGEEVRVSVNVRNNSSKTIRRIKVFIVQHVDVCMFSNGKFKNVVALVNGKEHCPLSPGSHFSRTFNLLPVKSSTKNWIALEDSYTKAGTSLASSVTCTTLGTPTTASIARQPSTAEERNVFAIYVSYYVKVKLLVSVLGGEVALKLPFTLMHTCNDFDPAGTLTRVMMPPPPLTLELSAAVTNDKLPPEKDTT